MFSLFMKRRYNASQLLSINRTMNKHTLNCQETNLKHAGTENDTNVIIDIT